METTFRHDLHKWKQQILPRRQIIDQQFAQQLEQLERFVATGKNQGPQHNQPGHDLIADPTNMRPIGLGGQQLGNIQHMNNYIAGYAHNQNEGGHVTGLMHHGQQAETIADNMSHIHDAGFDGHEDQFRRPQSIDMDAMSNDDMMNDNIEKAMPQSPGQRSLRSHHTGEQMNGHNSASPNKSLRHRDSRRLKSPPPNHNENIDNPPDLPHDDEGHDQMSPRSVRSHRSHRSNMSPRSHRSHHSGRNSRQQSPDPNTKNGHSNSHKSPGPSHKSNQHRSPNPSHRSSNQSPRRSYRSPSAASRRQMESVREEGNGNPMSPGAGSRRRGSVREASMARSERSVSGMSRRSEREQIEIEEGEGSM